MSSDPKSRIDQVIVTADAPISDAVRTMELGRMGIVLICDQDRILVGILTDGDIRRAILDGVSLAEPCIAIANKEPATGTPGIDDAEALGIMDKDGIGRLNHLPLVDAQRKIVGLRLRRDIVSSERPALSAFVAAGGYGNRLRPLTENVPKPMLPVGDRPLLELIINQLKGAGIKTVNVSTHYKAENISDYFGDGQEFGVEINYVNEDRPLGTAGAIGLLTESAEPLLVINADILTELDFAHMLEFHKQQGADMTVAVREHTSQVPFGVVEMDGVEITEIVEKPNQRHFVSAGIYLLNPEVCRRLPAGEPYDMPDLINLLISTEHRVVSFPVNEYWKDVGQIEDYRQAQQDVRSGKFSA